MIMASFMNEALSSNWRLSSVSVQKHLKIQETFGIENSLKIQKNSFDDMDSFCFKF